VTAWLQLLIAGHLCDFSCLAGYENEDGLGLNVTFPEANAVG
jgi:hypothetical protein